MTIRYLAAVSLCSVLVVACGGGKRDGSGVSGSKTLVSLSSDEITDLCEYLADLAGPPRTITCPDGNTINIGGGSISQCVAEFQMDQIEHPTCGVTVAQYENCVEAQTDKSDSELCTQDTIPPECLPLLSAECTSQ